MATLDRLQESVGGAGRYQFRMFLATQLTCAPVTAALICSVFDSIIPKDAVNCSLSPQQISHQSRAAEAKADFYSLLMELDLYCAHSYIPTLLSTCVMGGGAVGAGLCGYFADRFGRRPVVLFTVLFLVILNFLIAAIGSFNWILDLPVFFLIGVCAGGYMVTNFVSLLEVISSQYWRLGATSFNGWPIGLIFMAFLGYVTGDWRWYHVGIGGSTLACFVLLVLFLDESPKWLAQKGYYDAATRVYQRIASVNGTAVNKEILQDAFQLLDSDNFKMVPVADQSTPLEELVVKPRQYTYLDLLRYRRVWRYLIPLFYSWLASSIITYGLYFNMGSLYGNRYINLILTGVLKGCTGVIPFSVSKWVGRKPVLMVAVTATCLSVWSAVLAYFIYTDAQDSYIMVVLSALGVAAVDPIWKINHFYSAELFPTVVRNMARGTCNIGSRLGSVVAPQIAFLNTVHFALPFLIFGIVSIVHLLVSALFLPETRGKVLVDSLTKSGTKCLTTVGIGKTEASNKTDNDDKKSNLLLNNGQTPPGQQEQQKNDYKNTGNNNRNSAVI